VSSEDIDVLNQMLSGLGYKFLSCTIEIFFTACLTVGRQREV